jgi:DNA-binding MarR family transcriptional regulator
MATNDSGSGDVLSELVLRIFRLHGRLLDAGDRLTAGSGLTAARWQVLGAVLHGPLTVSAVARAMGLARQSVQRIADVLAEEGLCEFLPNPAHQRAKLLAPTDRGWKAIERIRPGVVAWNRRICALVGVDTVRCASAAVEALLEALAKPEGQVNSPARPASPARGRNRE